MWSVVARCLEDWSGLQRKEGRKEGREQRLKSEECLSAGCLGASVCYISCSHFEFFKWLLGPAHSHTHTRAQSISQIHSERDLLTCIEQSKACWRSIQSLLICVAGFLSEVAAALWFVLPRHPPLALALYSPVSYATFLLHIFAVRSFTFLFLFLFFGLRFSLLFVFPAFSAFWGQAFPSRQKNPNMFTRDLWRGIFVYVAFLRRRLRPFRRLCFASGIVHVYARFIWEAAFRSSS